MVEKGRVSGGRPNLLGDTLVRKKEVKKGRERGLLIIHIAHTFVGGRVVEGGAGGDCILGT